MWCCFKKSTNSLKKKILPHKSWTKGVAAFMKLVKFSAKCDLLIFEATPVFTICGEDLKKLSFNIKCYVSHMVKLKSSQRA